MVLETWDPSCSNIISIISLDTKTDDDGLTNLSQDEDSEMHTLLDNDDSVSSQFGHLSPLRLANEGIQQKMAIYKFASSVLARLSLPLIDYFLRLK